MCSVITSSSSCRSHTLARHRKASLARQYTTPVKQSLNSEPHTPEGARPAVWWWAPVHPAPAHTLSTVPGGLRPAVWCPSSRWTDRTTSGRLRCRRGGHLGWEVGGQGRHLGQAGTSPNLLPSPHSCPPPSLCVGGLVPRHKLVAQCSEQTGQFPRLDPSPQPSRPHSWLQPPEGGDEGGGGDKGGGGWVPGRKGPPCHGMPLHDHCIHLLAGGEGV